MIRFVLYVHRDSGAEGQALEQAVQTRFASVQREVCPDLESLGAALKKPVAYGDLTLYVLLADTSERLEELEQLIEYLEDKKILIVMPDMEKSSFVATFRMRPRYITQRSKTFADICDVLEKLMANHNRE
ncbi:MAG: hypothetical protein K9J81_10890 [Desulfohalobiaceae bacterium]|nr:hypothetical protein [Desulfohalobiaceae bacterium]